MGCPTERTQIWRGLTHPKRGKSQKNAVEEWVYHNMRKEAQPSYIDRSYPEGKLANAGESVMIVGKNM